MVLHIDQWGKVVSLALNLGYGWAADVNVRMIVDAFFSVESGAGYPPARRPTQQESRRLLYGISDTTHRSMAEIVGALPDRVVAPAITYPGIWELLDIDTLKDRELVRALQERYDRAMSEY